MRRLSPDEANLWAKVMTTVRPLRAVAPPAAPPPAVPPVPGKPEGKAIKARMAAAPVKVPVVAAKPPTQPGTTLDGSWDRRISRGIVAPDSSIDLHGHNLSSAYALLDEGLARAVARGDRVLLLVTGKPPRPESERPHARGAIRAVVKDWIAASRHAGSIAAIRNAHPRHGGQGALYIVLRRGR